MERLPLVSIIIPVYNGSNYLNESIVSALEQTYKDIEVIVVNDGSNDNGKTEEIALSYGERIRYFHKENGGVSSALNYGISVMKGKWFSWLSHDDLYYPNKIKAQIDYYNEVCKENEKCVLLCGSELIDCDGKVVYHFKEKKQKKQLSNKEIMLRNLKHNRLGGCTFLIPKTAFDEIGGFSEDNRTMSDFDMWYRLLLNGYKFRSVSKCLVKTRVHKKQVTYTMAGRGSKEFAAFYTWVTEEIAKRPEMCDRKTFYRLALYSIERGLSESAEAAFGYARKYEKTKLAFALKKNLISIYAAAYQKAKKIVRKVFAALAVK